LEITETENKLRFGGHLNGVRNRKETISGQYVVCQKWPPKVGATSGVSSEHCFSTLLRVSTWAVCWSIILATQEAEIRRISQPEANSTGDPTLKKVITKKGWWSPQVLHHLLYKCEALSSNPRPTKKIK
jgi:hypothetical protein